jgi:hypothetical protein
LTFVIKFLPILKGVSLIHVYSQNKLSRNTEENPVPGNKQYKEMDIIYGGEIKNSTDIEFRYTDPKKLKEVEKFFIEFYLSNRSNNDLFYESNHELKYFNYNIISIIEEIVSGYKGLGFENILAKVNTKLREIYMGMSDIDRFKYPDLDGGSASDDDGTVQKKNVNNSDMNNLNTNFLNIKKEFIIREIFREEKNMRTENGLISKKDDNTLLLSKLSENDAMAGEYSIQFSKQLSNISFVQDDTLNMLSYNAGYNSAFEDMATKAGIDYDLSPISRFRTPNIGAVNISNRALSPALMLKETPKVIMDPLVKLQQSLNKDERLRSYSNNDKKKARKNNSLRGNSCHYLVNNITNSPNVRGRHNSFLANQFYVKLSNQNISREVAGRNSVYQDIDMAYKKISDNKLSNIYFNIANSEVDNKEAIPGCVFTGEEEHDRKESAKSSLKDVNNHSFAPKFKDEEI